MAMEHWHPYATTFPLLDGKEFDDLVKSVERTKGNKSKPCHFRIVNGEQQGLDGRNREAACKAAGVKCYWEKVTVADDDVEEFIDRHNERRRHMTPEQREARILRLRAQGRSNREIAGKAGTSEATVRRTLAAAGAQVPDKVVGRDGKQYAATQDVGDASEGPILCKRCKRLGGETPSPSKGGCPKCRKEREKADRRAERGPGRRRGPRSGQALYDWRVFRDHFGGLLRQVDVVGRLYGKKESREAEGLRKQLDGYKAAFTDWHNSLARTPAPKE